MAEWSALLSYEMFKHKFYADFFHGCCKWDSCSRGSVKLDGICLQFYHFVTSKPLSIKQQNEKVDEIHIRHVHGN